jgi:hypothetical protein
VGDGTNTGNNAEALIAAQRIAAIGTKSKLAFDTDVTLTPSVGGLAEKEKALAAYRKNVGSAVARITIGDPNSQGQWDKTPKKVKSRFVTSFLTFLRKRYPNAVRSVSVVSQSGSLLAIGDGTGAKAIQVKVIA